MISRSEIGVGSLLAGRYRLLSLLGRGGMGIVFRGVHLGTERPVAVKVLRRELMIDETLAKRFVREAKAAASIRHPNVVDVIDYGVEEDGTAFQVLELLEGASLGEHLARERTLSIESALALLAPVIHALTVAHGQGVVHRDLKPDNIFLARNAHGRIVPKLLDFGIAKLMKAPGGGPTVSTLATRVGTAIGTPAYMSPEQASGINSDVGPTTDVWAIGVILFECVSGRLPFEAETGAILMARIITEVAPSIATIAPETPAPIARVIDRALASETEDRWQTMAELDAALRAAAAECGIAMAAPDASDVAGFSLPPPRDAARSEHARGPILGSADLATQVSSPDPLEGAVTREVRPRPIVVGGPPLDLREPASGPPTLSERARLPLARIALVSLVVIALVSLGLWMRAPDVAPPGAIAAPGAAAPEPARAARPIEAASAEAPARTEAPSIEAASRSEAPPAIEDPPRVEPPAPPATSARGRRRAASPGEPRQTPAAERAGRPGEQLPPLTEW